MNKKLLLALTALPLLLSGCKNNIENTSGELIEDNAIRIITNHSNQSYYLGMSYGSAGAENRSVTIDFIEKYPDGSSATIFDKTSSEVSYFTLYKCNYEVSKYNIEIKAT